MTTDQILFGLGLVLVLAVSSQLFAQRFGLPAIVVLLPVGFLAGIATDDVNPNDLLGDLYQPFVSIAVGIILFEAGLRLSFGEVALGTHRVVARLVAVGILVTCPGVALTVGLLFADMDSGVAVLVGAILVVSGPTVVLPLLAFIRPKRDVRSLVKWEGVLVDPLGALLGVLVFHLRAVGRLATGRHGDQPRRGRARRRRRRRAPVAPPSRGPATRAENGRGRHAHGRRRGRRRRRPHPRGRGPCSGGADGHRPCQPTGRRPLASDRRLPRPRVPRDARAAPDRRALRARRCVGLARSRP